ncbi:unnamed protein product [Mycena citricolor]|uniref:Uncharacterized protein n=1 Tax=Mycena citricolor TaxID=2018698 RepID=A0AAD2HD44_9AGAR|nr:unnamed protein product [Mycena citricolor]
MGDSPTSGSPSASSSSSGSEYTPDALQSPSPRYLRSCHISRPPLGAHGRPPVHSIVTSSPSASTSAHPVRPTTDIRVSSSAAGVQPNPAGEKNQFRVLVRQQPTALASGSSFGPSGKLKAKPPRVFDTSDDMMEALRLACDENFEVDFSASFLVPQVDAESVSDKERVRLASLDVWKATGYRFTVKDHPRTDRGHKTRLWCSQDIARRAKTRALSDASARQTEACAKQRFSCRSRLMITCLPEGAQGTKVVTVRLHHYERHEGYPRDTTPDTAVSPQTDVAGAAASVSDQLRMESPTPEQQQQQRYAPPEDPEPRQLQHVGSAFMQGVNGPLPTHMLSLPDDGLHADWEPSIDPSMTMTSALHSHFPHQPAIHLPAESPLAIAPPPPPSVATASHISSLDYHRMDTQNLQYTQSSQPHHPLMMTQPALDDPVAEYPPDLTLTTEEFRRRMVRHISQIRQFADGLEYQLQFNDYRMLAALEIQAAPFVALVQSCLRTEGRMG